MDSEIINPEITPAPPTAPSVARVAANKTVKLSVFSAPAVLMVTALGEWFDLPTATASLLTAIFAMALGVGYGIAQRKAWLPDGLLDTNSGS